MSFSSFLSKTPGELKEDQAKKKADRDRRKEAREAAKQSYKDERQTGRPRRKGKSDKSEDDLDRSSEEALLAALDETEAEYFDGDSESAREAAANAGFPVTKPNKANVKISRTRDGVPIAPFGWMVGYRRPADEEYISLVQLVKLLPHPDDKTLWPNDRAVFLVTVDEEGGLHMERFPTRYEKVFLEAWAPVEDAYVATYAAYVNGQAVKVSRGGKDKTKRLKFDKMSKEDIELVLMYSEYSTAAELANLGPKKLYKVWKQAIDKAKAEGQKKTKAKKAKKDQTEPESDTAPTELTESAESAEPATQPQPEEDEEPATELKTLTEEEAAALEEEKPLLTDPDDIQYVNARLDRMSLDAELKFNSLSRNQTGTLYRTILDLRNAGKDITVEQAEKMIDTIIKKG